MFECCCCWTQWFFVQDFSHQVPLVLLFFSLWDTRVIWWSTRMVLNLLLRLPLFSDEVQSCWNGKRPFLIQLCIVSCFSNFPTKLYSCFQFPWKHHAVSPIAENAAFLIFYLAESYLPSKTQMYYLRKSVRISKACSSFTPPCSNKNFYMTPFDHFSHCLKFISQIGTIFLKIFFILLVIHKVKMQLG